MKVMPKQFLAEDVVDGEAICPQPILSAGVIWTPFYGELVGCGYVLTNMYPWGNWFWKRVWRRENSQGRVLWEYMTQKGRLSYLSASATPSLPMAWLKNVISQTTKPLPVFPVQVLWAHHLKVSNSLKTDEPWFLVYCLGNQLRLSSVKGDVIERDAPCSVETVVRKSVSMRGFVDSAAVHVFSQLSRVEIERVDVSALGELLLFPGSAKCKVWSIDKQGCFAQYNASGKVMMRLGTICGALFVVLSLLSVQNLHTVWQSKSFESPPRGKTARPKTRGKFSERFSRFSKRHDQKRFTHVF